MGLKVEEYSNELGMFAIVSGATIKNLIFEAPYISTYQSGYGRVGVLVGRDENGSTINNIHVINPTIVSGWWTGGIVGNGYRTKVSNSSLSGGLIDDNDWVTGGIIGGGYDIEIKDSNVIGTILKSTAGSWENRIGGIAGLVDQFATDGKTIINNCIFDGEIEATYTVAGGIVGLASGTAYISNSQVFDSVSASSQAGGIVGKIGFSAYEHPSVLNISNTTNFAAVSASSLYGGLVGAGALGTTNNLPSK